MEEKIKKATDFLEGLAKLLPFDVSFPVESEERGLKVKFEGKDASSFLGESGYSAEALKDILWKVVNQNEDSQEKTNIFVDTTEIRTEFLENLAQEMSEKAIEENRRITLRPLNSFERRIVHLALSEESRVQTKSIGEGSLKKIVISPVAS